MGTAWQDFVETGAPVCRWPFIAGLVVAAIAWGAL